MPPRRFKAHPASGHGFGQHWIRRLRPLGPCSDSTRPGASLYHAAFIQAGQELFPLAFPWAGHVPVTAEVEMICACLSHKAPHTTRTTTSFATVGSPPWNATLFHLYVPLSWSSSVFQAQLKPHRLQEVSFDCLWLQSLPPLYASSPTLRHSSIPQPSSQSTVNLDPGLLHKCLATNYLIFLGLISHP